MSGGLWFFFWDPAAWVPPAPPAPSTAAGSVITIDPRFMDARSWVAMTGSQLRRYGFVPQLLQEELWRTWADEVVAIPTIASISPPDPDRYPTWEAFAFEFNRAVRNAGL